MRHTFLMSILLLIYSAGEAQNAGEQNAIETQIDAFLISRNKHDFSDMKNYIAGDCDFVNITCSGKEEKISSMHIKHIMTSFLKIHLWKNDQ